MGSALLIRWVHVLGMAFLLGGAALTWAVFRGDASIRAAATYEWLFWAGAGLLVATGVGNLGVLGTAVPDPGTSRGLALSLKLIAVVGLLVGSAVRTLAVVRWLAAAGPTISPPDTRRLAASYAATAVYLALVVALAQVLAHG